MSNPSATQKRFHNALATTVGCIACRKTGIDNHVVSIHHIDGRTKPGAHWKALPLCAGHHQDGCGNDRSMIAVHPYKKRFETAYGKQMDLLSECHDILRENGFIGPICAETGDN